MRTVITQRTVIPVPAYAGMTALADGRSCAKRGWLWMAGIAAVFCLFFGGAVHAETVPQKPHHHTAPPPETDFDCAVHTAYGEARNTSREEEAVVINLLVQRARLEKLSICRAAHKFFKPRKGSTPGILDAAKNVLQGDKSLVPQKFLHATEMRAYNAPKPPPNKFRYLGSVDHKTGNGMHGNIFYEPVGVTPKAAQQ